MIECCRSCNKYMKLEKSDYSNGGCKHSDYDGFACLAFVNEGIVVHMVGVNPDNGFCEAYSGKTYDEKTMKVPTAQPEIIRCKDCKYQVKEWRDDKRLKDKGYWVYGCKVLSDICGYWAWFGQDDEFCSEAKRRTVE